MKKLMTEWRKFLKETALNSEENRERLVRAIAAGLPEDQQPGFMKSETRKLKLDDDYFQRQYEAYEEEMEDFEAKPSQIANTDGDLRFIRR